MKEYYQILGVSQDCSQQELRRKYRELAMRYHPDRNPGSADAEEKFKEIAEAYGVLTDPVKRREYDMARQMGGTFGHGSRSSSGFQYSQEDILRDLFKDPRFQQMFNGLLQEFARRGLRANQSFITRSFFGGKGIVLSGLFFFGSMVGPTLMNTARKKLPEGKKFLGTMKAMGDLLKGPGKNSSSQEMAAEDSVVEDTVYTVFLSREELTRGTTIRLMTEGDDGPEQLRVQVPAESSAGSRLRLRGKGVPGGGRRGDLFLVLQEK